VYGGAQRERYSPYAREMPVIVVGADTPTGEAVVASLTGRDGDVRAFVSSEAAGKRLKARGVKVAVGDISDGSHIGGAARNCFSAVLDPAAAGDGRKLAFAGSVAEVFAAWAEALADAAVTRAIWVGDTVPKAIAAAVSESAAVPPGPNVAEEIRRLDELAHL